MSQHLLIIGGGHTGSSAALAAARQRHLLHKENELMITLMNSTPYLGIRPRFYEYELEQTQVALQDFLQPIQVKLIIAKSQHIDLKNRIVSYIKNQQESQLSFDSIVLAAGSELVQPNIMGIEKFSYNIDNFDNAKKFRSALEEYVMADHSNKTLRIAILGGGLTGVELATELPLTLKKIANKFSKKMPSFETFILDRHQISTNLGDEPEPYLEQAFQLANVSCINHASIEAIQSGCVIYNNNSQLKIDFIVSTLGIRANRLSQDLKLEKDSLGRIKVNNYLQIPNVEHSFAAGDFAVCKVDGVHDSVMSCQQGRPQGRYAGFNAVSLLYEEEMLRYSQPNYVTCIDLGAFGALYTEGWGRNVKLTGSEAKQMKRYINAERIYPPTNADQQALFEAGNPEFLSPVQTMQQDHPN